MNCGASRWAYNYALNIKKDKFDKKEKIPNNIELHREINKLKGTETLPWASGERMALVAGFRLCGGT